MKNQKPKASILAVSLIIMGVMIVIALGISFSSLQSRKSSIGSSKSNVAFQNADSGVEVVMKKIKSASTIADIDTDGSCDGVFNSGNTYRVELRDSAGQVINAANGHNCTESVSIIDTMKSTGYSSQDSRAIEVAVAAAGSCTQTFDTIRAVSANNRYEIEHELGGVPKFVQVYYCRFADSSCSGANMLVQAWRWAPGGDYGAEYGFDDTYIYIGTGTSGLYLSPERVDGGSSTVDNPAWYRIVACR